MKQQERRTGGARAGSHSRSGAKKGGNTAPVANEAGLSALGQQMQQSDNGKGGRHRSKKKATGRHRVRKAVLISLVVLLVLVGGGAGYTYYVTHDLNRVEVKGLNGALTTGKEAGTENILMVGSTSRCALTVQNPAYGLCSQGVNGVNSDVIMILHADPAHHRLALLSLPRDLFIPNARSTGANKVDAGLFQGLTQLVAAIEEDFGIPIQHAVSLNFDQFANIVDALGGINMAFPISVFDAESGLNVQAATCVHLNGTQALQVVRARHLQYDSGTTSMYAEDWPQENLSDLARIRRDHEFLRVLGAAVAKQGLGNPLTDLNLINSVKSDLTFDQSWAVSDMANLVLDFHSVDINAVPQLTMPVAVVTDPDGAGGGLQYQGGSYGDVEFPSQPQDESVIDQVLGIGPGVDPMTGSAAASLGDGGGFGGQRYRHLQPGRRHGAGPRRARLPHCRRGRRTTRRGRVGDGRGLRIKVSGRRSGGRAGGPLDDRFGHHGLRSEPGDRRRGGDGGHRFPVHGECTTGTAGTLDHRRAFRGIVDCPVHAGGGTGHHLTHGIRHRRPVAHDVRPRAMGSQGLPGGSHPHRPGGQPHLTGPLVALPAQVGRSVINS